jgi:large subunit ribosomal protein L10
VNREQKAAVVAEIADQIKESEAVFAVDYRGITVAQVAELRGKLRDSDATFRVVKNTLTERAADAADAEALKGLLEGPTALTFVRGDAAAAAKTIADYQRSTGGELLPFKGGLMDGAALDASEITAISKLPSRQVLYGQLVGMVASPLTGLVRSLNGLVGGLAIALGGVLEKKQSGEISSGDAPAAAPVAEAAPVEEEAPASEPDAVADTTTTTDQDAEANEPPASSEEPTEGTDDSTTQTQED